MYKATPWCTNRLFEWCSSIIMIQCGALAIVAQVYLHASPQIAFMAFANLGLHQVETGAIFLAVGALRAVALFRNGHWNYGPIVRAICAVIGAAIWVNLLFGIVQVWLATGEIYLSFAVWDTLLIFEGISFTRAMLDIKPKTPAVLVVNDVRC